MTIYEAAIEAANPTPREREMSDAYEGLVRALTRARDELRVLRIQLEVARRKPGKRAVCQS